MVVAGNVETSQVKALAEKWFGNIEAGEKSGRNLPVEAPQTAARTEEVKADVPLDGFYKTWHIEGRLSDQYHAMDLLTDILGGGESSRLYQKLVKELQLFVSIQCYHFGSIDPGLFTIEGKLVKGVDVKAAEAAVEAILQDIKENLITNEELEKVKNKTESIMAFEDMSVLNRATSLAFYELLGDANMMNTELQKYADVTVAAINKAAKDILAPENSNTLYYLAKN
ncbi:M16 family metallopeptidase [Niabella hibiscisoli]|uniref:M16 family metallopeptidase n=1 Tax=Niabella hibiscisoli TaxID=1825928 RepID=UPI001F0D7675|nr:insulinase family protein [Niabella hibiscisoli]MCH5715999.1 insulinase family protein [Niabella hibiscisoli]